MRQATDVISVRAHRESVREIAAATRLTAQTFRLKPRGFSSLGSPLAGVALFVVSLALSGSRRVCAVLLASLLSLALPCLLSHYTLLALAETSI